MRCRSSGSRKALTLLELLVVIGLIGLFFGLLIPVSDTFLKKAKKAKCISNLRTLHSGLSGYYAEHGHWPQMEEGRVDFTEDEFFRFWVEATEPYGLSQETWLCPMDQSFAGLPKEERGKFRGSYVVTRFDKKPPTPFRWNQPWAMERGDLHGQGAHILMPDGSVQDSRNPFHGR